MNRLNRHLSGAFAALFIAAAPAMCAADTLFIDEFTDSDASYGQWINESAANGMSATVNGGSCTINNSANPYFGEYIHAFGANKPAVFTFSYTLKSVQGTAGALFCRQSGDAPNGYILTAENDEVVVYKAVSTTSGNSVSINFPQIFRKKSFEMKPADNELTVSKSGSSFHVFVNGVFEGSFTDASYNAGDISFALFKNSSAVFGAVRMTNTFTPGSPRTSFHDDFNGNGLKYWQIRKNGSPSATEANGVLTVKTIANEVAWMSVDFEYADFTAKVEASHRAGSTSSSYGILLVGESAPGQNIPMAYFTIRGDRKYTLLLSGAESSVESNPAIRGASNDGKFFVDSLELRKDPDRSVYEFFANGTLLDAYPVANVGFKVIGIGIFCYGDLEITFDNFSLQKEGTTSVKWGSKQISRRAPSSVINRNQAFYDLRGRKRYAAAASSQGRIQTRAAGIYVNKNGRDVAVKKGRVVGE